MTCYKIDGVTPIVHPSSYIHPTAVLIGNVIIKKNCYIGPGASLRGDFGRITIEEHSNIQDNCIVHGSLDSHTKIGKYGHIGHGAILHGCVIGDDTLVGMNAVIMDRANIGAESIVAASSFVKNDFSCNRRSLLIGSPAKLTRQVSDKELQWNKKSTERYINLTIRCLNSMVECNPLVESEADRNISDYNE